VEGMIRVRTAAVCAGLLAATILATSAHAVRHHAVVTARAGILIDNQTGEVLWQRNPDLPLPPASTTKIVTAMVALQSGRLEDSLTVTPQAAAAPPSKIGLRPGWKMRLRDLVYALLLNSANDAAIVIAEGLSGSVPEFAARMNAEARLLGATNTHFVNPNGLPAANHYSTARDLTTMFARALGNPLFETVVSTKTTSVRPATGPARPIALRTHNRLLGNYRIQVLGKTGWTRAAKRCFVGAARADGREIGVAVLGSTDLWGDLKRLLDYGFGAGGAPEPVLPAVQAAAADSAAGDDDEPKVSAQHAQRYFVSVGTFRSMRSATRLRSSLAQEGYRASIQTTRRGGHAPYRVLVGSYPSRQAAEHAAAKLKRKTHHTPTVVVVRS
jgi:D-alanyl-D-alanine carboxypeptidase (penicillin-binding protein 5/6)